MAGDHQKGQVDRHLCESKTHALMGFCALGFMLPEFPLQSCSMFLTGLPGSNTHLYHSLRWYLSQSGPWRAVGRYPLDPPGLDTTPPSGGLCANPVSRASEACMYLSGVRSRDGSVTPCEDLQGLGTHQ